LALFYPIQIFMEAQIMSLLNAVPQL